MKKDFSKRVSRRDFLKISGGVMGFAVMSSSIFGIFNRVKPKVLAQQTTDKAISQWCMVIDLGKCEGCVTIDKPPQCTQACIAMHFIPKGQQWIEVYKLVHPDGGSYYLPAPCFQCENAPCVRVCPVKATYHNEEGIVLIDQNRCIGCRLCMAACPYQRRFFNWGSADLPPGAAFVEYSPEFPVPAKKGTVIKCIFCAHLLKEGKLPGCVIGCPMGALYMGDFNRDKASNGIEVVKLSRFLSENHAYRYKEELGTQPRVFYLGGHGEDSGRSADDLRELKSIIWPESGTK